MHHTTIINWVKEASKLLPDFYEPEKNPELGELNELQTFVGSKKTWIWTAVDNFEPGILGWALGDHSATTFEPLWAIVSKGKCYFYVTDGWKVNPNFITEEFRLLAQPI